MCILVEKSLILLFVLVCSVLSFAQKKSVQSQKSHSESGALTWDLGASVGSYAGASYSQIDLGLNWRLNDYLTWRNDLFSRFGNTANQASGLDSSLRFEYNGQSDGGGIGYRLFAGPGVRISTAANTGYFAEAGTTLRIGGLNIGGGVKVIQYTTPGRDSTGQTLSPSDVSYFLIFSGGGVM